MKLLAARRGRQPTSRGGTIADLASESIRDPVYVDSQLVVKRTEFPLGLRFAGEIDINNSGAIARSLMTAFPNGGTPHLDFTNLVFCDISGIRALVTCAQNLGPGRVLLIHGLPEQLATVMRVTGWADLPYLEICDCEATAR